MLTNHPLFLLFAVHFQKSLPSGVRYILDIDTGAAVEEVGELARGGGHYAVSSTVRLVKTFNYRSLNLLQRHLAAAHSSALDVPPFYHPDSTIFSAKNAQRHENLLTRSTGAVSGQQYSSSNNHHHHKSAVFGLHHLSNSAHLPSSGHRTGHSKHVTSSSNGSSSLTLSASLSIYSNYGGYTGGISSSLRPKIVALLRGSCRAGPSLRPSRKPIRFLLNYRIAQTFEQLLNEISASVVASQCQQQVQQQHHQLNVVGAVHQVYGLATNKRVSWVKLKKLIKIFFVINFYLNFADKLTRRLFSRQRVRLPHLRTHRTLFPSWFYAWWVW